MDGNDTFFGLNLADGRIQGYPKNRAGGLQYYARFVRGGNNYGKNYFVDNNNNTITDTATGLMWTKFDSGGNEFTNMLSGYTNTDGSLNWEEALHFAENLDFAGYTDWRLPNAKELQSILDYSRSPDATNSAAIDPIFNTSSIINEAGVNDYPGFWAPTTFNPGTDAVVIYFGRALGYMDLGSGYQFYDVHGAGAQRTDLKEGQPSYGFGLQGDVRRVYNYVRLVRNAGVTTSIGAKNESIVPENFTLNQNYPNPFNPETLITYQIPVSSNVQLKVYDVLGWEVTDLVNQFQNAGSYTVKFNSEQETIPSGIYFYQFSAGDYSITKKMICIR